MVLRYKHSYIPVVDDHCARLTGYARYDRGWDVGSIKIDLLSLPSFQQDRTASVDPAIYEQFVKLLNHFAASPDDESDLYASVCRLLKGFPDLVKEFCVFISPSVAIRRGVPVTQHVKRSPRPQEPAPDRAAVNSARRRQVRDRGKWQQSYIGSV